MKVTAPIDRPDKPSAEECCRIIYVFMREHEGCFPRWPHMNMTLSEWRRLKKLAKMGMARAKT